LLLGALYATNIARADDVHAVVAHPGVHQQNLSRNAVRAIFGMRLQTWPDGTAIKVFVLPDEASLHKAFSKETLNVFPHQLRSAWDRLVFSGTGQAPSEVASEEEMLARVAGTPGAIGYLTRTKINDTVHVLQIK
jgi:ABC-type phosphate transport system substrate-binding protein